MSIPQTYKKRQQELTKRKEADQMPEPTTQTPNAETIAAIKEGEKIIKQAKNGQGRNLTLAEMFNELEI